MQSPVSDEERRDSCIELQAQFFEQYALIIASNRGPVTILQDEQGQTEFQRGSGGLVTALSGLAQHVDATWIACALTPLDAQWRSGQAPLAESGSMGVRFLDPEPAAYDGYYNVIANPLLWFLQHSMWDVPRSPVINRATWDAWEKGYVQVNRLFAIDVLEQVQAETKPSLVMFQDYHLYLAPGFVRAGLQPGDPTRLLHFVHIPWPGPEYWGLLPPGMRQPILESLCAADVLGFQTRTDGLNFIRTCESFLHDISVDFKRGRIWFRNHSTYVRDFPISIDVEKLKGLAETPEVAAYREELESFLDGSKLIARIDRIEPSKNIVRGFLAFEEMLALYPELQGEVKFLAVLVPSRLGVDEYQDYLDELSAAAGRVNAVYGSSDWEPVRVLIGENYARAVAALQLYDVLLVNAIADGMNLVAKEGPLVNRKDGVLVLSEKTGAFEQLQSGVIGVSPCDVYATAEAMHQALVMNASERAERAQRLRWVIEREDIVDWLCRQVETVVKLDR